MYEITINSRNIKVETEWWSAVIGKVVDFFFFVCGIDETMTKRKKESVTFVLLYHLIDIQRYTDNLLRIYIL